jgi:DNA repair exonuclease SbcCD ATPase subunit
VKDTQRLIDQLLGADFKTFIQTAYFGQGRTIHYASLTPREQKAVLENILPMEDVDRWAGYAEKQAAKLHEILKPLAENRAALEGRVNTLQGQFEQTDKEGFLFEQQRAVKVIGAKEALAAVHESFKPSWEALGEPPVEVDPDALGPRRSWRRPATARSCGRTRPGSWGTKWTT